jgi:hypothetical protein
MRHSWLHSLEIVQQFVKRIHVCVTVLPVLKIVHVARVLNTCSQATELFVAGLSKRIGRRTVRFSRRFFVNVAYTSYSTQSLARAFFDQTSKNLSHDRMDSRLRSHRELLHGSITSTSKYLFEFLEISFRVTLAEYLSGFKQIDPSLVISLPIWRI